MSIMFDQIKANLKKHHEESAPGWEHDVDRLDTWTQISYLVTRIEKLEKDLKPFTEPEFYKNKTEYLTAYAETSLRENE
jgi:hypothetical protein